MLIPHDAIDARLLGGQRDAAHYHIDYNLSRLSIEAAIDILIVTNNARLTLAHISHHTVTITHTQIDSLVTILICVSSRSFCLPPTALRALFLEYILEPYRARCLISRVNEKFQRPELKFVGEICLRQHHAMISFISLLFMPLYFCHTSRHSLQPRHARRYA